MDRSPVVQARLALARLTASAPVQAALRTRFVRAYRHYSGVDGGQQAAAVTYYGFLSVFPILALAFFVVGWVAKVYPDAHQNLLDAVDTVLPGLIGGDTGQVSLTDIQDAANKVGLIGLVGVLYAGLGWLSSLRDAVAITFEVPRKRRSSFVVGKARDLVTLVFFGVVLLLAVGLTGLVQRSTQWVLDAIGLGEGFGWLLWVLAVVFGLAANTVLFLAMFRLPQGVSASFRHLLPGAVLGAVGFEVLKELSSWLLASTRGSPAFQVFGISVILLVWINYFSQLTLYAAAFAHVGEAQAENA